MIVVYKLPDLLRIGEYIEFLILIHFMTRVPLHIQNLIAGWDDEVFKGLLMYLQGGQEISVL